MPVRKSDYGPDWDHIATEVKTSAGWKCEWCGAPHRAVIQRLQGDKYVLTVVVQNADKAYESTEKMVWARLKFFGLTRIILTTAHLDRNNQNHDRSNLAALCQRCHLSHDILQHIANRRYGRDHKRDHQYKLEL